MHLPLCIMLSKKTMVPMSTLGCRQITCPQPPPPLPPPPALVDNIAVSGTHALELAILSSGLQGAHHRVAALLSSLVVIDATCIKTA